MLKFTSLGEVYNPIISGPAGYRHLNTSVLWKKIQKNKKNVIKNG